MTERRYRARHATLAEIAEWTLRGGPDDPRLDRVFVLEAGAADAEPAADPGPVVGRVALAADPVGTTVATLEHRIAGLELPWDAEDLEAAARTLLDRAIAGVLGRDGGTVDARVNPEWHPEPAARVAALRAAGFELFQEKAGRTWIDDGRPLPAPERLRVEPVTASPATEDALRDAMARAGEGTLDRVDRHYRALTGPQGWATEMFGYLTDEDAPGWLLARDEAGAVAGYVLVGAFGEPDVGTIIHIGVVPEARGRGHVHDLLRAANLAARARGFSSMLSDVDTENAPMLAAMERAGHLPGRRPWHVWHLRRTVAPAG